MRRNAQLFPESILHLRNKFFLIFTTKIKTKDHLSVFVYWSIYTAILVTNGSTNVKKKGPVRVKLLRESQRFLEENLGSANQYTNSWSINTTKCAINLLKSKSLNILYLSKKKFYKYNFANIQKMARYINRYTSKRLFLKIIKINGSTTGSNIKTKL